MPMPALLSPCSVHLPHKMVLAAVLATAVAGTHAQAPVAPRASASVPSSVAPPAASRPTWAELTTGQREALAPLAPHWSGLSESHKRKWITISRNFSDWPADEQSRIHGRMSAWASLSTVERDQARTNFTEARKVAPDEKKARWEAYQALSDEQRDKLAATVAPKRPGVTVPARQPRPVGAAKLTPASGDVRGMAGAGLPTSTVDHNTLLPQHLAAP